VRLAGLAKIRVLAALSMGLGLALPGRAATNWNTTATTGVWNTVANWSAGVPTAASAAVFTSSTPSYNITFTAAGAALGITFNAGGSAYTFANNGFVLSISGSGITNNTANTEIFNVPVTVAAAQTWNNTSTGGLTFGSVTLSSNLTLSGAANISVTGTLTNSTGNRTLTNNSTGGATLTNINLSESNTARTLTVAGTGTTTVSGVIANGGTGAGVLSKTGTGTLILSGANTYTGATTVGVGGVLNIQNNTALGTGAAGTTVASGAALQMQNNITVTGKALTLNGTGVLATGALRNISGANTWTGNVTLGSASRINSDAGTLTISGNIGGNTQNLTVGGAGTTSISGIIGTTTGTLTKDGTGTLTLSGINTYTGATTVSAGILNIQNATALGTTAAGTSVTGGATLQLQNGITVGAEALTLNGTGASGQTGALVNVSGTNTYGGLITLGSASTISSDAGTLNLTNAGTITGSGFGLTLAGAGNGALSSIVGTGAGTLTKNGAGTWTLSGANTYTGATTINGGILTISADNNLGTAPGSATAGQLALNGGTLQTAANMTLNSNRGIALGASGGTLDVNSGTTLTYGGIIAGSSALTKADTGTLVLSGANTYTGATKINAGTLQLGANNVLSNSTAVTVASGATLNLNNFTDTIGSLAGSGVVTLGSGTLTVGSDNTSTAFSGAISGTGGLTKTGTGTLTISGANTYSGATTVSSGTLAFGAGMNLSTGSLVLSGGTLNLGSFTSTFSSLTVSADSILDFNGSSGSVLNILNNVTINSGVTLTINNWVNAVDFFYSQTNPNILGQIVFTPYPATSTHWESYDKQITPVPEPATYGALLLGLGTLLASWRLRRRRTS
jgi:fibronectin-binding autotransporter adhesin